MIVWLRSWRNWVRGSGSSSGFQSASRSSRIGSKRLGGLSAVPRDGMEMGLLPVTRRAYAGSAKRKTRRADASRGHQHPADGLAKFGERKRFRQAHALLIREEAARLFIHHVASDEDDALGLRAVFRAQPLIDFLSAEAGHFPIAERHVVA